MLMVHNKNNGDLNPALITKKILNVDELVKKIEEAILFDDSRMFEKIVKEFDLQPKQMTQFVYKI